MPAEKGSAKRSRRTTKQNSARSRTRSGQKSGGIGGVRSLIRWRTLAAPIVTIALVAVAMSLTGTLVPGMSGGELAPAADAAAPSEGASGLSDAVGEAELIAESVVPTTQWVNFYGLECMFGKEPVPAGAVITAHDPQGVACGETVVTHPGRYGLMAVYADDPTTPEDEGATPGDAIELRINNIRTKTTGPDEPVWTAFGDLKQVELSVAKGLTTRPGGKSK
jgi:hypothetical protein